MDVPCLKELESRLEIIAAIEKGGPFGGEVWQSRIGPQERIISRVSQIYSERNLERVVLRTPCTSKMDVTKPLFVRLNYRNLIFRILPGEFKVLDDKISCFFPREARALEERKGGDRYVLPLKADLSLSLKRLERTMREVNHEIELRILDVSTRGFGVSLSASNRDFFKKSDRFWLSSIDQKILRTPVLGSVCYVAPKGSHGDTRLGLSLSLPIDPDIFESLKRKCLSVLTA